MESRHVYDYVVVGGGTAGCVLAARLSEDAGTTVCLIEAGPPDTAENIHVPVAFGKLFRTRYDWDYDTHEEPFLDRRRIYLPRGRVLGGCSSTNTMIYIRGNRADYDGWNQPSWSFEELLPYFKRSEDNERGESAYHAVGGPLSVSDGRSDNPMMTALVEAAIEAGHARNDDFNGAWQDGFGRFQLTQRDGMRCSASTAFLGPALIRPNLTVMTNAQVHRVIVEEGTAVGVSGEQFGEEIVIRAEAEVILAAGAYNSPQLLLLSGIGPAAQLSPLGIPVVLDHPRVGQNLQDHSIIPLVFTHDQPVSLLAAGQPEHVQQFMAERRGMLTSNGPEAGGFVRTEPGQPAPDVEYLGAPVMFADSGLGAPTGHAISLGPTMLSPLSRGYVTLASEDPTAKPKIHHNYFAEPDDMRSAMTALRLGLEICRQPALEPYTTAPFRPPASESDADLRDYIRNYAHSIFHAAGTCAIGTVVDANLRVQGIDALRVADASVMPTLIRGNPNATVIAIAEKAADLIKGAMHRVSAGQLEFNKRGNRDSDEERQNALSGSHVTS